MPPAPEAEINASMNLFCLKCGENASGKKKRRNHQSSQDRTEGRMSKGDEIPWVCCLSGFWPPPVPCTSSVGTYCWRNQTKLYKACSMNFHHYTLWIITCHVRLELLMSPAGKMYKQHFLFSSLNLCHIRLQIIKSQKALSMLLSMSCHESFCFQENSLQQTSAQGSSTQTSW